MAVVSNTGNGGVLLLATPVVYSLLIEHADRGLVSLVGEMFNQRGERVLLIRWSAMIAKRP